MTAQTPATLKSYFEAGDRPTQQQFADTIDSFINVVQTSSQSIASSIVVSGNVNVAGSITVSGSLNIPSSANLSINNLTVAGKSSLTGVSISGITSARSIIVSALTVSGQTTLTSAKATTPSLNSNSTDVATTNFVKTLSSPITVSLSADVPLNNTSNYFDGPNVAQGTSGIWFSSGIVTLSDSTGPANMLVKLWDGTTIIASGQINTAGGPGVVDSISLSGYINSPAGNLRISVRDATNTTGIINFSATGNGKDSTITAIRIG